MTNRHVVPWGRVPDGSIYDPAYTGYKDAGGPRAARGGAVPPPPLWGWFSPSTPPPPAASAAGSFSSTIESP
ncbi:MAG: hypothetical protein ABF714_12100, partial [Novacetimonas hansenii]|uniref:hypothetical protein n=1 Tax=Novacetimonas hansenii TaxID=436 RepID=UPI0039EB2612